MFEVFVWNGGNGRWIDSNSLYVNLEKGTEGSESGNMYIYIYIIIEEIISRTEFLGPKVLDTSYELHKIL